MNKNEGLKRLNNSVTYDRRVRLKLRELYKNLSQEKKDKIKEYQKNISRIGSV